MDICPRVQRRTNWAKLCVPGVVLTVAVLGFGQSAQAATGQQDQAPGSSRPSGVAGGVVSSDPQLESYGVDRIDSTDKAMTNVTSHELTTIGVMRADGTREVVKATLDPVSSKVTITQRSTTRQLKINRGEGALIPAAPGEVSTQASGSGGCCSAEGWRWVRVWTDSHSALGALVFTYNEQVQWGWGGGIPGVRWGEVRDVWHPQPWFSNIAGCCFINPRVIWQSEYFFGWSAMNYSWNTGWSYQTQGEISNCVFRYGCFGESYPRINIWAHANGSYDWSTGP